MHDVGNQRGLWPARLGVVLAAVWLVACAQPALQGAAQATSPTALPTTAAATATATATAQPKLPQAPETLYGVTERGGVLVRFSVAKPEAIEWRRPLVGLPPGDAVVGIDFRVAKGVLFALTRSGKLFTVDTATGVLTPVGAQAPLVVALRGERFGVDFNPAADRIRVVSNAGQNLRLHPDTGVVVDFDAATPGVQADPGLRYASGDAQAGQAAQLVAAGYTYNTQDDKVTTNFAIDARLGTLVTQGSREGVVPAESPNLGVLHTVGALGTGPLLDAGFDISDVRNTALLAVRTAAQPSTTLYRVDLSTGAAQRLGTVGDGQPLLGLAIEP